MIGVVTRPEVQDIAAEFFELFKTPWEFYRADGRYDVVIDAEGIGVHHPAALVIVYGGQPTPFDRECGHSPESRHRDTTLLYEGNRLPIYEGCVTFPSFEGASPHLVLEETREPVVCVRRSGTVRVVRVGYDLFREVWYLLTTGQPSSHAGTPTLDRHIAFLRDCIIDAGLPLVEIPPIPEGYRFIACLTHDIDHPSIRRHKLDHTMFGFLYRATLGSLVDVCRRRRRPTALGQNLAAALLLPFVHLGWARDFWSGFEEYLELEKGLRSTYFVIPFKDHPGRTPDGDVRRRRASSYGVSDIAPQLKAVVGAGCEVGLHGLDAWVDGARGAEERESVSRVTGTPTVGARMHWLYWDEHAAQRLEQAEFDYDSTFGYNHTVGFRAGTLQAFKPINARHLLEMPLAIMDTALFYPSYLNLTADGARQTVRPLIDHAAHYGGALTINWHDRSLAPERLWGDFYRDLVDELKRKTAWFPTAAQAVSWFRQRRSAVFHSVSVDEDSVHVLASADRAEDLPGLTVRVHKPRPPAHTPSFTDLTLTNRLDARVQL